MLSFDTPVIAWVMVAIVSAIIEVSVPHFGVIFASLGATAAAIAAALGFGLAIQLVIFVVVLAASLAVLRPRLIGGSDAPGVPTRTGALVGREGIVTHDIDPTLGAGRINVGGEDWAARCAAPLPIGTRVRVVGADGIILEVTPA
jgi:membrane protein implicated in regulation of membrane protease activity